ncbi:MAG: FAD-dependent oxidoreductase [Patescibacteria group bacterium]
MTTETKAVETYDLVIVGAGITGTSVLYALSKASNVKKIAILEKYAGVALVNSHPLNNSQTSHDGSTETNYNLQHAMEVQRAAKLLRGYVEKSGKPGLFKKTHRMVLAVGETEVVMLRMRFEMFKNHYPDLRLIGPEELAVIEPKVMEGRPKHEPVCALISTEGYAVNYQATSQSFLNDAQTVNPDINFSPLTEVQKVSRDEYGDYLVETNRGVFRTKFVEFAAGPYSLKFAHSLGYGKEYTILSVAGSFFTAKERMLNGKVYRCQKEEMPFAEIHGDPDVLNQQITRFGPTTKPILLMERHKYRTFADYARMGLFTIAGILSLIKITMKKRIFWYVVKNLFYEMPILGRWLFTKEVKKIIPTIQASDLEIRQGAGGVRPQIVDKRTGELQMGDKTIVGDNCIFNTTPSPGASVCLANAIRDAERIVKALGPDYHFDRAKLESELMGVPPIKV